MQAVRYCEACGHEGSPDARFCGACRRPFPESPADEPTEPGPPVPARPLPGAADGEVLLYDLRPLVLQSFPELALALLTAGLAALVLLVRRWDNRYRVTSQRIELVTGVLSTTHRTVELHRVQDLELRAPLFLRLRAAGDVVVRSMDVGEREVVLRGIQGAVEVHETLRAAVLEERRRHHVRVLEGV